MSVPLCPSCQRTLLSRLSPLCNRCGARVPETLLYTAEERKRIQAEDDAHDGRMKEKELDRAKARSRDSASPDISHLFWM